MNNNLFSLQLVSGEPSFPLQVGPLPVVTNNWVISNPAPNDIQVDVLPSAIVTVLLDETPTAGVTVTLQPGDFSATSNVSGIAIVSPNDNGTFTITAAGLSETWVTTNPEITILDESVNVTFINQSGDTDLFAVDLTHGETLEWEIAATPHLAVGFDDGASVEYALQLSSLFQPSFITGETAAVDLQLNAGAQFEIRETGGQELTFEIANDFTIDSYNGESIEVYVQVPAPVELQLDNTTGEFSDFVLRTLSVFPPIEGVAGDFTWFDLLTIPPTLLQSDQISGQSAELSLSTTRSFFPIFEVGSTVSTELTDAPAEFLSFELVSGTSSEVSIATSRQLNLESSLNGQSVHVSLDFAENWSFTTGEFSDYSLSTNQSFEAEASSGEWVEIALTTGPSQSIGVFISLTGESSSLNSLSFQIAPRPIRVNFGASQSCFIDMSTTGTSFDTTTDSCCPRTQTQLVNIDQDDVPASKYGKNPTIVYTELSTRARFQVEFNGGQLLLTSTDREENRFDLVIGNSSTSGFDFSSCSINARLCEGNFIPLGDEVDAEITTPYDENCAGIWSFAGSEMNVNLSCSVNFFSSNFSGEHNSFGLAVSDLWNLNFYSGSELRVVFTEIQPPAAQQGESLFITLEDMQISCFNGAGLEIERLVIDYDVEFTEHGCFDNEYIPQTTNGDPDISKFNPVPVENKPYLHNIKARCF